ncbi:MAG: hypothetical protein ACF8XB_14245, partial [Planctomycetota bacterium JB042]
SALNVGRTLGVEGRHEEALVILEESNETAARVLDDGDELRAYFEVALGECLANLGRYDEGAPYLRAGVERAIEHLGPGNRYARWFAKIAANVMAEHDPAADDEVARYREIAAGTKDG